MKTYWINKSQSIGVITEGSPDVANNAARQLNKAWKECPVEITSGFDVVTEQEYNDTVLDLRYEEGRWQQ